MNKIRQRLQYWSNIDCKLQNKTILEKYLFFKKKLNDKHAQIFQEY